MMPPEPRHHSAAPVAEHIPRIGRGVRPDFWADPFEQQRPENKVRHNFRNLRRIIVQAQAKSPVQPKNERQRAGNQPAIIKMIMKKSRVDVWFDEPTVDGISGAANQKERVTVIAEAWHGQSA